MIGRRKELKSLEWDLGKKESQFIAVYGRRRVGKTYLVRQFFQNHFAFVHVGVQKGTMADQLLAFRDSLVDSGDTGCPALTNWRDAFRELQKVVQRSPDERKVVFIDELPWMDTPCSKLVMALDHFWNAWAAPRGDVVLVVCGSATSWIIGKIVKDRGGLHNRLTDQIWLAPFTLGECEQYVLENGLKMSRTEIAEYYMVLGGVPYYWSLLQPGLSVAQNLDRLIFARDGKLRHEYSQLYASLFRNSRLHLAVVDALCAKGSGLSREEISRLSGLPLGGHLKTVLEELEQCGFIRSFRESGCRNKGMHFQLMDNFTLFHTAFLGDHDAGDECFCENSLNTPRCNTWRGLAFERLCFQHIEQIRRKLGIGGVLTGVYAWHHAADRECPVGAQIDLLIDRADGIVNVCEMKWSKGPFLITSDYERKLQEKVAAYENVTRTRKSVHLTLVTKEGILRNAHSGSIQSEVILDDLFQ